MPPPPPVEEELEPISAPGLNEFRFAATIVMRSNRERPADGVLRETLRGAQSLDRRAGGFVSRAVFAYYRWLGWLSPSLSPDQKVAEAWRMQCDFDRGPSRIPEADLLRLAVPPWVRDHMDIVPAWVRAIQREPVLWLRTQPGDGPDVAAALGDCEPLGIPGWDETIAYKGIKDLYKEPSFQDGLFEIQDLHSQAVGRLCAPAATETWWDACAGEGGKLLHLSALMENKGLIWATDRSEGRLERLRQRASRAGVFNYRSAHWDGAVDAALKTRFDGVLVDAPCSNLGTWHRNPHARWTVQPSDITELREIQINLLAKVAPQVKPGGKLVYAVCTLTREETVDVVAKFNETVPGFTPLPVEDPFAVVTEESAGRAPVLSSTHWLLPERRPANGMFVALWRRDG